MSDEREWWDYESGPFCQHWSTVGEGCDDACRECGHACADHDYSTDAPCKVDGCACPAFVETKP